jgi:hypothetical protein
LICWPVIRATLILCRYRSVYGLRNTLSLGRGPEAPPLAGLAKASLTIVIVLLLHSGFCSTASAQMLRDTQFRPSIDVSLFRHGTTFSASLGARTENNVSHLFQNRVAVGASRQLMGWMSMGARYMISTSRSSGQTDARLENRWSLYATPRLRTWRGLVLSDRNMLEFRRISGELSFRYRNEFQVERRFGHQGFQFSPYLSLEPIYDTRYGKWNRQPRASVGVAHPFSEHVSIDVSYMRQVESRPNSHLDNNISTVLQFRY